ncbi:hypothetical protein U3516DRAFT_219487 [Neocallimastix sp. 'constans']
MYLLKEQIIKHFLVNNNLLIYYTSFYLIFFCLFVYSFISFVGWFVSLFACFNYQFFFHSIFF